MAGIPLTAWAKLGVQRRPESVTALLQDVANITVATGHRYVWRGHRDARYLLHSSLHRRLVNGGLEVTADSLLRREKLLRKQAMDSGYQNVEGRRLTSSDLLARLQHAGAATPLLDVTPDPFIGLFFATEPGGEETACALIAIRVAGRTESEQMAHTFKGAIPLRSRTGGTVASIGIYEMLRQQRGISAPAGNPILWEAPFVDDRMRAQRGMFLATTAPAEGIHYGSFDAGLRSPKDERSSIENLCKHSRGNYARPPIVVFYISAKLKTQVARELDRRFGYRTETIYPDLAGFALANSSNRSFPPNS